MGFDSDCDEDLGVCIVFLVAFEMWVFPWRGVYYLAFWLMTYKYAMDEICSENFLSKR